MLSLRSAAHTDIGRVRRENEDRFLLDEKQMWFGVADGVGGLPGGAEAAQLAVEQITAGSRLVRNGDAPDLVKIVHRANQLVAALGQQISPSMGIGTTLTIGCIVGGTLKLAHVGDSRCYGTRRSEFFRLTEDHSVENEARLRRSRGEVVYYHEANRNALTRCIGQPTPPEVDLVERRLEPNDRYLFCTDGVTRMVPDSELAELLLKHSEPEEALHEIIGLAVRRGGPDNATGVAVFVDEI
jgi:serine/threonine protein phosphatase PrpC